MAEKKTGKSKRSLSIGIAAIAWLIMVLVILVFFLINKSTIMGNWDRFASRVFSPRGDAAVIEDVQPNTELPPESEITTNENITVQPPRSDLQISIEKSDGVSPVENITVQPNKNSLSSQTENKADNVSNTAKENTASTTQQKPASTAMMDVELCFVTIDADGNVGRKIVTRAIPHTTATLTASINALLGGPTKSELNENCQTLIPAGSRLLGATIRDGVAYLNFSGEFEINTVGVEGYTAQMMQIVYTATHFPTVNSVQFLINGERKEYLGSEGLWIGSPLTRLNFR